MSATEIAPEIRASAGISAHGEVRAYTIADGREYLATRSGAHLVSSVPKDSVQAVCQTLAARDELYASYGMAAPVYHHALAPVVEDRLVVAPTGALALPTSYSLPSSNSLVSYGAVPTIREGRARPSTESRVVASAAQAAAAGGFVRVGDQYFPNDNYHASTGRYYVEETPAATEVLAARTAQIEAAIFNPPQDVRVRPAEETHGLYREGEKISNKFVAPSQPLKMRHQSRSSYSEYRSAAPPAMIFAQ